jgi:hypothetical protein
MNRLLLELANRVENHSEFNQIDNDHCVVGLGDRMIREAKGLHEHKCIPSIEWSQFFGVSSVDFDALLVSDYANLNIGFADMDMRNVTASIAADVVRKLAARG